MTDKPTQKMFDDGEPAQKESEPLKTETVETNDVVSGNVIDLPSKGLLGYPASVQHREMLVKDEEALAQMTDKSYFRTVNNLISDLIGNPDWFRNMSVHDRDYLLIYIWSTTYSPKKDVNVKCSKCEEENYKTVDFTQLDFTDLDSRFKGFYDMKLESGESVRLRLNTVADELECEQFLATGDNDKKYRYEHLMLIKSIDINLPLMMEQKLQWVESNVKAKEMSKIKSFHVSLNYGVPGVIDYTCNNCDSRFRGSLPFGVEDIVFPNNVESDIEEFV